MSGGLGRVLGCALLLLPPGEPGLRSRTAGSQARRAASCHGDKQLPLRSVYFVFL